VLPLDFNVQLIRVNEAGCSCNHLFTRFLAQDLGSCRQNNWRGEAPKKRRKAMAKSVANVRMTHSSHKPKVALTRTVETHWIDFEEVMRPATNDQEKKFVRQILRDVVAHNYQPGGGGTTPIGGSTLTIRDLNPEIWRALQKMIEELKNSPYTVNVHNQYGAEFTVYWDYQLRNGVLGHDEKVVPAGTSAFLQYPHCIDMWKYSLQGLDYAHEEVVFQLLNMLVADINASEQQSGMYHHCSDSWVIGL
jgi:hypothetical protein